MNTMMKAEIASESNRSRSQTPKAGRRRTPEFGSDDPDRGSDGACRFPVPVFGLSGIGNSHCIQIGWPGGELYKPAPH
jgi:hypothetical protein